MPLWLVASSAAAAVVVLLGAWWFTRPGDVHEGDPPEGTTVINRVVEGPLDQISRTGPVTLWTPLTTQPPRTP